MQKTIEQERRDSFRIDMTASVTFTAKTDSLVDPGDYFRDLQAISLISEYKAIDQELFTVSERIRDLATLKSIELIRRQVEILSKLNINQSLNNNQLTNQTINISEGGCSFLTDKPVKIDDELALALVFQPSFFALFTFAKVKEIRPTDGQTNNVHLSFSQLSERQAQELMKHMFQAQTVQNKQ